ncbi:MAG: arylsulfatase [Opitutales bacterium]|nr:arylsulfatase [Opitutales bacterium]
MKNTTKFVLSIGIIACALMSQLTADSEKPNIIYILADDLGYGDLSCYGQKRFETPNIDRMAKNGMRFTQHYSGATVCAPSRSALMTGQHTGHTYIRGNKEFPDEGQEPLPAALPTMAKILKKAGYTTGAFGKWGLGFPGSEGDPINQGFDEFYGYNCQRIGHHYYPWHLWHNDEKIILEKNTGNQTGTYAPNLIHEKTLEFIEKNKDKPFFCFVPSIIPHAELFAPEEYMEKFRGKFLPERSFRGTDSGKNFRLGPYGSQPEAHAAFVAMVTLLDDQVGEILSKLEELGIADNTLVMFTSDNGPHKEGGANPDYFDSNGPFKGTKRDLYEGGIRVPMIAQWPAAVEAGSTSEHISAFWDMLPTFAELSGADVPANIDGISMVAELKGKKQKQHPYLYWEFHERGGRQAIRVGKWKGVRYHVSIQPDAPIELYDLSTDPGETTDLANEHPKVRQKLENFLKEARVESSFPAFNFPEPRKVKAYNPHAH